MNTKKLLCTLLSLLLMLGTCLLTVSCDNTSGDPTDNDQETGEHTLGNIQNTIDSYTVIRSDKATQMVKNAVVLLRTSIESVTGIKPEVSEDWVEEMKTEYEILIGETTRPESIEAMKLISKDHPFEVTQIGTKICLVGIDDYSIRRAVYQFLTVYFGVAAPNHEYHNVIDFGAEGDGKRDETESFMAAIEAAKQDGLPVYVPAGTYIISDTLELDSVTLCGYHSGAWTADDSDLPVIVQTNLEAPVFHVIAGSLSGLLIDVKGVSKDMEIEATESIRLSHAGARVSNMKIYNPYIGISTFYDPSESVNPGRCFIENIFIVNAYEIGVNVHGTWDVATLCNIEVWSPHTSGASKNSCNVAYKFGKNDDLRAVNLFTFNAKVGFLFEESDIGGGKFEGCWGSFTNCSTDLCETGIKVGKGQHALTIIGGTYWNHFYGLQVTGQTSPLTRVTMTGCELKTNGDAGTITIAGGQMITVTGCNISRTQSGHSGVPVSISGGVGISVSGNTICANNTAGIDIAATFTGAAAVTGNTIITSNVKASSAVTNKASSSSVVVENNAVLTNYKFE